MGPGATAPPGRSRGQYQFVVLREAQTVFAALVVYDQFAATPEESLAGNPLLRHRWRRARNTTWRFALDVQFYIHDVMMVILIVQVKRGLRMA